MKPWRVSVLSLLVAALVACGGTTDGGGTGGGDAWTGPADVLRPDAAGASDGSGADAFPAKDEGTPGDASDDGGAAREDTPEPGDVDRPALHLVSVEPARGPTDGGTLVMITGAGFAEGLEVRFGDAPATDVFVVDDRFVTCATPAGGPGVVAVSVRRPADGAEATLAEGFRYEDGLFVEAIEPALGPSDGGTPFTVRGRGFAADAVVAVGGRLALRVEVLDDRSAVGVTPPGDVGPADVTVLTHGDSAHLPNGFRYRDPLRLERVEPPTGSSLGGQLVTLVGAGFERRDTVVTFAGARAEVVRASSDGAELDVRTPAGTPGPVAVAVEATNGAALLSRGYTYLEPAWVAGVVAVHAVVPAVGATDGGDEVAVIVTGLPAGNEPVVRFGDAEATVLSFDRAHAVLLVETPPHTEGAVRVTVDDGERTPWLDDAFTYEAPVALRDIDPPSGPAAGGTPIRVRGRGFAPGTTLYVGAFPAVTVDVRDAETIVARTPAGSPGPSDVRVVVPTPGGPREARLRDAFSYESAAMALLAVDPRVGSQAGGTWVRIRGIGIPEDPVVTIGGEPVRDVQRLSAVEAVGYTPSGDPGTVDVVLRSAAGASARLRDGYTYFDPARSSGGTWGSAVDGAVNVTVLESSTGFGLGGALVLLGSDAETTYQGFTDGRGQITFSGPDLVGPVEVSAAKPGYTGYSVIRFDAENVTVWLQQTVPPQGGGGGGVGVRPEQRVVGRVLNADKHLTIPPGDCADLSVTEPPLCLPCASDRDCGDGHRCTTISDYGRYCTRSCETGGDCPTGYLCRDVGPAVPAQCVPRGGTPRIFCRASDPSFFGGATAPGPFTEVNQHHDFNILTNPGEMAIFCVAGADHPVTGRFEPLAMGIVRHVFVPQNGTVTDIDVLLDIRLDRDLTLVFSQLPEHPAGTLPPSVRAAIDLGSDGWLRLDTFGTTLAHAADGLTARWPGQPETLSGGLDGTSYTFYVTVNAATTTGGPYSSFYREGAVPSDDDRLLVRDPEGVWSAVDTGVGDDLQALWGAAPDDAWGVSDRGRVYHRGPAGWTAQPVPPGPALRDLDGASPDDAWAVGDRGRLLRFNGVFWESWDSVAERADLVAVAAAAPDAVFAATRGGGVLRFDGAQWVWLLQETGTPLYDVWAPAPDDVWVVGAGALALRWDGETWREVYVPTGQDLHAIHGRARDDAFVVGAHGRVFRWNGLTWQAAETPTERTLRDVRHLGPAEAIAVGDDGVILHWNGVNWLAEATELNVKRHLRRLWAGPDDSVWVLGPRGIVIGPFMGFPFFTNPVNGGVLDPFDRVIRWDGAGDVAPTYNYLVLSDASGYSFWTTLLDGSATAFALPPLEDLLGVDTLPSPSLQVTVTRALNPAFSIDGYQNRELGTFRRSTWSTGWVGATAPPRE